LRRSPPAGKGALRAPPESHDGGGIAYTPCTPASAYAHVTRPRVGGRVRGRRGFGTESCRAAQTTAGAEACVGQAFDSVRPGLLDSTQAQNANRIASAAAAAAAVGSGCDISSGTTN
jgi:hypothetical protein